ncbi:MAG: hypothetical protein A2176_05515 [Spirochaetes bacterium RBG_13_51_14]|nr:MAG: hypothetical protein A2176_05515 [Spirochaetes bacterium RBG_13_51_14]
MFEKTKLIMLGVFTVCFLAYSFLVGKFYEKLHVSRALWVIVCAVLTVILAVVFIIDLFHSRQNDDR